MSSIPRRFTFRRLISKHVTSRPLLLVCVATLLAVSLARQQSPAKAGREVPNRLAIAGESGSYSALAPGMRPQVNEVYGRIPLSFEANQGQTDPQVKFLSRGSGYSLFLTSNEAVLLLNRPELKRPEVAKRPQPHTVSAVAEPTAAHARAASVLRIKLAAANPAPKTVGLDELSGKSNYFMGDDPQKWRTNVANYARVRYQEIYPGVDLVYYGNQDQLEHDFVVAPGANPKIIAMRFEGERKHKIAANGDLVLSIRDGEVRLKKPRIYQDVGGSQREIAGGYVLKGRRQVGFAVATYDTSLPLVIDPVLCYSTYLGGNSADEGRSIAVDSSGSAYVTGYTFSTDFPTTTGTFQTTTFGGSTDAFVTKLNPTGSALVYSTYLGGGYYDFGHGIAVDASGNAYVTGDTSSTDFPTTAGAFQTTLGGIRNGFVTKLNPSGSAQVYSTYLGGSYSDAGLGIAADRSGNACVTGLTFSTDFPTTAGAFQPTFGGGGSIDAFVTKLNPTGSAQVYSTYLGGSGGDEGLGIAVDASNNAYVTGFTQSTNFPTTSGAFQPTFGGYNDAFVTKLNATGSAPLVYSTYLGGSDFERGFGIAVDTLGNAYVTGVAGTNFPTTSGAFQTTFGGIIVDAFATKINPTGSAPLVYSTYLGGSQFDQANGIAVDASDNAYVTGVTTSTDFPTTSGAFQTTFGGYSDAFVTKLNPTGSAPLVYSTYLGGDADDSGNGIAVDPSGSAYITGTTSSIDFPTTTGAFQAVLMAGVGCCDAFVTKFTGGGSNIVSDFSIVANPNGDYSYGYTNTLGSPFMLYEFAVPNVIPGLDVWRTSFGAPALQKNTTASSLSYFSISHPPDMLNLHPGPSGQYSVLRFAAPCAGTYRIEGSFQGIDTVGTTTDVHVLTGPPPSGTPINSLAVFNGSINSVGETVPFSLTLAVTTGQTIDFAVGVGNGDYFFDSTGLKATITAVPNTPTGTNTTVVSELGSGSVTTTFSQVFSSGSTSVVPIDPASAGTLPGGFALTDPPLAFEIQTSATVIGPIQICFYVPSVDDSTEFSSLRVLHNEGGTLVNRTILPPDSPGPDFATRTICARVTSLSPFVIVRIVYNFTGFFQPVDNLPIINVATAGSAIPVKFSLGGNKGLNIFAAGYPVSQQIACPGGAPIDPIEETATAGGSSLSYDATTDQYKYVWKTNKAWKGMCRQLILNLNDGTRRDASFQFK